MKIAVATLGNFHANPFGPELQVKRNVSNTKEFHMTSIDKIDNKILEYCCQKWFKNHAGIAALELGRVFDLSNKKVMSLLERLVAEGFGTINKNVSLYSLSISEKKYKMKKM